MFCTPLRRFSLHPTVEVRTREPGGGVLVFKYKRKKKNQVLKLSMRPSRNSSARRAALGAYCGTMCPARLSSSHVRPRSVCVVPSTPAAPGTAAAAAAAASSPSASPISSSPFGSDDGADDDDENDDEDDDDEASAAVTLTGEMELELAGVVVVVVVVIKLAAYVLARSYGTKNGSAGRDWKPCAPFHVIFWMARLAAGGEVGEIS